MPELPEVETIRTQLEKNITGKKIARVEIFLPKILKLPAGQFKKAVLGAKIQKIKRRAKILVIELDNGRSILIHLKMTGQLILHKKSKIKDRTDKHTHVIFRFSDGGQLFFNDLRQFGYIKMIKTGEINDFFAVEKFGPEPLDKKFGIKEFGAILAKRPKMKIKQFLMDPKNIAGIGNIYSDEILFFARVNPLRPVGSLSEAEIKNIFSGIKKILPQAVKFRGTSAENYLDAFGQEGQFLKRLKVYGREDENCPGCQGKIKRIKLGGRSAHFCPACQR